MGISLYQVAQPASGALTRTHLAAAHSNAEPKSIAQIKDLNPFEFKKHEFLVNVVIKKIDMEYSWWYTAYDICRRTARPYGNAYKCVNETYPPVVGASPRFKLNVVAGDDTADTKFVLFGCVSFQSTAAAAPSIGFSNPPATPSIGLNSPSAVGAKGKSVEIECQSKTPNQILDEEDQDDDNLPLSQMGGHSATKNNTSKSYNKRHGHQQSAP
ncbi:hypothetical protein E2562_025729 [Oryza meyeriana var. granulata]|uniref:Uncharacterized protein n=1 Tax=Oryza meyeriana var. granulata TaxID=110450 RepID=A0A6G1CTD2_9ORYZ|nr:hypothetical protein E2562_025729 [Oryza meyeriana var. granulata]